MANNMIAIPIKDLYQMLIGECRYGYTRNNHLMPDGAYEKVRRLIPQMYEVDTDCALHALDQICEECITQQILFNFNDGEDDEMGNRQDAISFVEWCINWMKKHGKPNYEPYGYESYLRNLGKDTEPRFNIYEVQGEEKTLLTTAPVSKEDFIDFMLEHLYEAAGKQPQTGKGGFAEFRKQRVLVDPEDPRDRRCNYFYTFLSPVEKTYFVEHL